MAEGEVWDELAARVREWIVAGRAEEAWAEIDRVAASGEAGPPSVPGPVAGYREVATRLYWKHRSLPAFIPLQREQIRRLEGALAQSPQGEERSRLLAPLGGVYYNLAAFTWPGWGDEDLGSGPEEVETGRWAAQRCLEIRQDPANADVRFPITLSMAHWVRGAFALSDRDWAVAREQFTQERDQDREAGEDDALARGYLALTDLLERPDEPDAVQAFDEVVAELEGRSDEDAPFFREQLLTARKVVSGR